MAAGLGASMSASDDVTAARTVTLDDARRDAWRRVVTRVRVVSALSAVVVVGIVRIVRERGRVRV